MVTAPSEIQYHTPYLSGGQYPLNLDLDIESGPLCCDMKIWTL